MRKLFVRPQKRHNGKTIHIRALPGAKVKAPELYGVYKHIDGARGFFFTFNDPLSRRPDTVLLDRLDWEVV